MQENKNRYIDLYMGLGILLLVLRAVNIFPESFEICVEAFGILMFFTAAGLACGERMEYKKEFSLIFKENLGKIMVPYFWISLFAIVLNCGVMLADRDLVDAGDVTDRIWGALSGYGGVMLWVVPALFAGTTCYQFLRKLLAYPVVLVLTAILAAVICAINGIPVYLFGKSMSVEVFFLQVVYVLWRGCVGMFFCAIGEGVGKLFPFFKNKKLLMIVLGFLAVGLGSFLALKNQAVADRTDLTVSFRYLLTGELALYFLASALLCAGLLFLCKWVGVCRPLEFLGKKYLIILGTYLDFKVVDIAKYAGDSIFAVLDHDFVRNMVVLIVTAGVEILMLWLLDGWQALMYEKKHDA